MATNCIPPRMPDDFWSGCFQADLADKLSSDWRIFASCFGIEHHIVEQIRDDNRRTVDQCSALLARVEQRHSDRQKLWEMYYEICTIHLKNNTLPGITPRNDNAVDTVSSESAAPSRQATNDRSDGSLTPSAAEFSTAMPMSGAYATVTPSQEMTSQDDETNMAAGLRDLLCISKSKKENPISPGNSTKPHLQDSLDKYEPLQRPYGQGLLVIVSLFTEDLIGYKVDRKLLKEFFASELRYKLVERVNIGQKDLFEFIGEVHKKIEKEPFDRLVFVILTHGLEGGLLTCGSSLGDYKPEEDKDGNVVLTEVREIVDRFKHDKVTRLKDRPKLFLIQACRGENIVKIAGPNTAKVKPNIGIQLQEDVPVDADILALYAATERHQSFVDDWKGSWLIQTTVSIFQKHYKNMHVEDMMTKILSDVAQRQHSCGDAVYVQMPEKRSTLRRSFWLYHGDCEPTTAN